MTPPPLHLRLGTGALLISGSAPVYGPSGEAFVFHKMTGWDEPPGLRIEGVERSGSHGSTAGKSYLGERVIVIEGHVLVPAGSPTILRDSVDKLMASIPMDDELFVVYEHGLTRHLQVRQGGQPTADRIGRKVGSHQIAAFSIQLTALDPRRLSGDGSAPTEVAETAPGAGGSVTLGLGIGPEAPVVLEVTGYADQPVVAVGKRALRFNGEVHEGETLRLDLDRRRATLNSVDVTLQCTGQWPQVPRKSMKATLVAQSPGSTCVLTARGYKTYP